MNEPDNNNNNKKYVFNGKIVDQVKGSNKYEHLEEEKFVKPASQTKNATPVIPVIPTMSMMPLLPKVKDLQSH